MASHNDLPVKWTPRLGQAEIMHSWGGAIQPLVSVICATHNHEEYIREAMEGFLMQETYFPYEVIVQDDASTDSTAAIVREYAARYPRLIKPIFLAGNQFSKGRRPYRLAFPHASGDFIALCDGDDYWIDKFKLRKQIEVMQSGPGVDLVYANFADTKKEKWLLGCRLGFGGIALSRP